MIYISDSTGRSLQVYEFSSPMFRLLPLGLLAACFFTCFVSLPTGAFDNLFPILYDTPRSIFIFAQDVNYPVLTMNIANGNKRIIGIWCIRFNGNYHAALESFNRLLLILRLSLDHKSRRQQA